MNQNEINPKSQYVPEGGCERGVQGRSAAVVSYQIKATLGGQGEKKVGAPGTNPSKVGANN